MSFLEFVENRVASADADMITGYAVRSYLTASEADNTDLTPEDRLRIWIAGMILGSIKPSTRKRYVGKLHSLYKEWNGDAGDDPFLSVRDAIEYPGTYVRGEAVANLDMVSRVLKKSPEAADWQALNIFLYLLYDVRMSVTDMVNLRFESADPVCPQIEDILTAMHASPRRKYVFELSQGKVREQRIVKNIVGDVHSALRMSGMRFDSGFSRDSITAIWIAGALRCGIHLPEIRAMVDSIPSEYEALSLVHPAMLSVSRREEIIRTVADLINDNASRWFVMRLRAGKTPEDIDRGVCDIMPESRPDVVFYYPKRIVTRKENKKLVREEVPYIPGILFFRMRKDRVASLFHHIGDMAWCYRISNRPDSPYSVIPRREMERFQRQIGQFTPDIKIDLVERETPLEVGSRVRINGGGMMVGLEGLIEDVHDADGTCTYTLRISQTAALRWTVRVDGTFVQPVG